MKSSNILILTFIILALIVIGATSHSNSNSDKESKLENHNPVMVKISTEHYILRKNIKEIEFSGAPGETSVKFLLTDGRTIERPLKSEQWGDYRDDILGRYYSGK